MTHIVQWLSGPMASSVTVAKSDKDTLLHYIVAEIYTFRSTCTFVQNI